MTYGEMISSNFLTTMNGTNAGEEAPFELLFAFPMDPASPPTVFPCIREAARQSVKEPLLMTPIRPPALFLLFRTSRSCPLRIRS